jgi:hypothetical protein
MGSRFYILQFATHRALHNTERFQLLPEESTLAGQCRQLHRPGQVSTRLLGATSLGREDTPDGMMIK